MGNVTVTNNEKQKQFEIKTDGEMAVLEYRFDDGNIALMHTLVPDAISGKGIASLLAQHAFDWAKEQHKKVLVYCAFVSEYLKKHPEYNDLIAKDGGNDG